MKKLSLLLVLTFIAANSFSQDIKTALFIGNSYIGTNNLPNIISTVANSLKDSLYYDQSVIGGYTLKQHFNNPTTKSKLKSHKWDYVILQEQSQLPSFPPAQVAADVFPYADSLVSLIKSFDSCTRVIFFMTWGRKNGDQANCPYYPPLCTYDGMQARLRLSYLYMGQSNHEIIAPVGVVWKYTRDNNSSIELYSPDESHPSVHGSYLAACTFYSTIFKKSPLNAVYPKNHLTSKEAETIQKNVNKIVFDSLNNWNIDTVHYDFKGFSIDSSGNGNFSFNPKNDSASNYFWDFGDGSYSVEKHPTHIYLSSGKYRVMLICGFSCQYDSTLHELPVFLQTNKIEPNSQSTDLFSIYDGNIKFNQAINIKEISLFDLNGKQMSIEVDIQNGFINMNQLAKGVYILKIGKQAYKIIR